MNKAYGIQGGLINFPFKDLKETIYCQDGIEVEIKDGVFYVGVDDERKIEEAKEFAKLYLAAWSERQKIKTEITFNHRWFVDATGTRNQHLELVDDIHLTEQVQIETGTHQVDIQRKAFIITKQMHDSASFTNDIHMVRKARNNNILKMALLFYNEEVVDNDRPLYGIYKSIEVITKHLGASGRTQLAKLAGEKENFVQDLMQTANSYRHSPGNSKMVLGEQDCHNRARILIEAFANSLP